MKRIALLTVLLLMVALASGFAEDGTPVTVTGSLGFGIGVPDFDASQPGLPQFDAYESTSATAKIKLSLADDAISAGVDINLLALPTVTFTQSEFSASTYPALTLDNAWLASAANATVNNWAAPYRAWLQLTGLTTFWNDNYATVNAVDGTTSIWVQANLDAAYATLSKYSSTTHLGVLDSTTAKDAIVLYGFANADFGNTTLAADIAAEKAAFQAAFLTAVNNAIVKIVSTASAPVKAAVTSGATLDTYLNSVTYNQISAWTADDRTLLKQAADIWVGFNKAANNDLAVAASSIELEAAFLSGATVTFKKVAGLLDISYLFGGQHVAAGSLNADYSGHSSTAVDAYSGLNVALSSGVVPNLSAGLSFYATKPAESESDLWYSVLADETAAVTNPTYGIAVNGAYTMAIMEGTSFGLGGAFAVYLSDPAVWALSVKPSFSGFGATLGGQFDYGLGGVMVASANVGYTIMGITVSPFFKYVVNTADYLAKYVATVTTIDESILNGGGMEYGANLSVDVSKLVSAVPLTVTAGLTAGGTGSTVNLEWNAGLSATMAGFTLAGNIKQMPLLVADNLDWDASLSYVYDKATFKAALTNAYSADLARYVMGAALTCEISL